MLGFSRETLIAVITNIEGCEFHRRQRTNNKQTLEHPRASSTDGIECFFSMMRDVIDQNFTTKEVKFGMRKIISQFVKRVDPDLPFYYHSSFHTRFYEGSHPEFDKKSDKQQKEKIAKKGTASCICYTASYNAGERKCCCQTKIP